jgi:hypothetical protein
LENEICINLISLAFNKISRTYNVREFIVVLKLRGRGADVGVFGGTGFLAQEEILEVSTRCADIFLPSQTEEQHP